VGREGLDSKTHVLVTGGAGFIGRRLVTALLGAGARVTVLTRDAARPAAEEVRRAGAAVVAADVCALDRDALARIAGGGTVLCHLAADVSVAGPALRATNVEGTRRLLDAAAPLDVPYVVAASSIEAQGPGAPGDVPLAEDAPARPVTPYGESKLEAERVVADWAGATGRPCAVLRIGNVYGPGSPWLLRASLAALVHGTPLGAALGERCLQPLYVDDLARALVGVVAARPAGLFTVAGAEAVSLAEYWRMLARLVGLEDRVAALLRDPPAPALDPDLAYFLIGGPGATHRVYDSRRIRDAIGEYARRALDRGLAATLAWAWGAGLFGNAPRGGQLACTAR
jgi:UDP-glucose 4-epimerase